ncbi:MAG: hypothetical protein HN712_16475 [Gemmatimonadetes bacterium]|nr:hypothetical protein [Gemmatimonadota bacterium]MBT7861912.1 hypothetical protein [Gemmatimonadota bacterium]
MTKSIIPFFILALGLPALGFDTLNVTSDDPLLESWRWREFSLPRGGSFKGLHEDSQGRIWFATTRGAHRFDGIEWLSYGTEDGLADDDLQDVIETRDGSIWFATRSTGISRFDGISWTTYTTSDGLISDYIANGEVLYEAPDGQLWAGFSGDASRPGGLCRFDGTRWHPVELPSSFPNLTVKDITATPDGTIWAATGAGVLQYADGEWSRHAETINGGVRIGCTDLEATPEGHVWTTCQEGGLSRWDGETWTNYPPPGPPYRMQDVWRTEDGQIWTGGALQVCRVDGDSLVTYDASDTPQLPGFTKGLQARDGSVWYGREGRSRVLRYDPVGRSTTYRHPSELYGGFPGFETDVWFHTTEQAVRHSGDHWIAHGAADGFLTGPIFGMQQTADGSLWFFGDHHSQAAVARWDGTGWFILTLADGVVDATWPRYPQDFPSMRARILVASDGAIWMAGEHEGHAAVSRWDGSQVRLFTPADGLKGDLAMILYEDSTGQIWTGTKYRSDEGAGLHRWDGQRWHTYTKADGLASSYISWATEWPSGSLWFGTKLGFARPIIADDGSMTWWNKTDIPVTWGKPQDFVPNRDGLWFTYISNRGGGAGRFDGKDWHFYTEADGLQGNGISHVADGGDGSTWFVSSEGLTRYFDGTWQRYGREEGLFFEWIDPTLHLMEDGTLWISTSDGRVVHFRPQVGVDPPETELAPVSSQIAPDGDVYLAWHGLDRWQDTMTEDLWFQWQLDEAEWSAWSQLTSVALAGVSAGDHQLVVRAMDRDGNVDDDPPGFAFVVSRPWWKDARFLVPLVALLGLLLMQTVRVFRREVRLRSTRTSLAAEASARERLDEELTQLRYLYRLRSKVATARTVDDVVRGGGETLLDALSAVGARVEIAIEGRIWNFGSDPASPAVYERSLEWRGADRGTLCLISGLSLSETQERALVDETAAQIGAALEARELEAQLVQSARLVSMGQMSAAVAHELNQPLTVISGVAEDLYLRLADQIELPEEVLRSKLRDVMELSERMAHTVRDLRVFSRDTAHEPGVPTSLNEVVEDALRLMRAQLAEHNIRLELDLQEGLPEFLGHSHQLQQVIVNLLSNGRDAVDAVAPDDRSAPWEKWLRVLTSWDTSTSRVRLEIEDSGIGMTPEVQARIFEPFFTTKEADQGTGLGMSISYAIVRRHGGDISCESRPGQGTVFQVMLPAVSA